MLVCVPAPTASYKILFFTFSHVAAIYTRLVIYRSAPHSFLLQVCVAGLNSYSSLGGYLPRVAIYASYSSRPLVRC